MDRAHRRRGRKRSPLQAATSGSDPKPASKLNPETDPHDAVAFWLQRRDRPRFVYVIQDGDDGPVKIGEAFDPRSRLGELQCGNHRPLNLRAVVLATDTTEKELHALWARSRMRGEWFGGGDEVDIIAKAIDVQSLQVQLGELNASGYGITNMVVNKVRPTAHLGAVA